MRFRLPTLRCLLPVTAALCLAALACEAETTSSPPEPASGIGQVDAGAGQAEAGADGGTALADAADAADAGKILAPGLLDPIGYKSRADSPFEGVTFGSYFHFEDWEDGAVNTPGVTASSNQLGSSFGAGLIDSVDGDDGAVDGKCEKTAGTCNSGFAGGTIEFTFDAAALGALPTHVGIVWTDGATGCDAVFEAFDEDDQSLGTKTAAGVGDNGNFGTVDEDRFFGVVHAAGIKKIVVKSSAGGVEVDHLQYGR